MALIIDAPMPKGKCRWHDEQGKEHECQFFPCTGDADNCPIIAEIPDKHGRIVDLDEVLDWLVNERRVFSMAMSAKVVKALSDAPVILEAST